jgi:predicted PurR-regulated permease PerM
MNESSNEAGPGGKPGLQAILKIPVHFLVAGAFVLLGLWFLRSALAPFFMALVLSYLLGPAVALLARRMSRTLAVLVVILGSLAIVAGLIWILVPILAAQVERLAANIPAWKEAASTRWWPWLRAHPGLYAKVRQTLDGLDPVGFIQHLGSAGAGVLGGFLHVLSLILVPLMIYYLLVEGPDLLVGMEALVPPRHRSRVRGVVGTIHVRLGGYIRGQLAVALVMTLLQGLAFQILGLPYPWLLGLVAGFSNVVPYSPYLTALCPALLMTGLGGAAWTRVLLVAGVFTLVQKTETLYFTPVWVGRASKLHPLEVLLALMIFGFAFGLVGLIFAIPLMIVSKVLLEVLVADYKAHPWYRGDPA